MVCLKGAHLGALLSTTGKNNKLEEEKHLGNGITQNWLRTRLVVPCLLRNQSTRVSKSQPRPLASLPSGQGAALYPAGESFKPRILGPLNFESSKPGIQNGRNPKTM